ncbi:rRNA maturation RNase YbeY [Leptotrichia sp. OH3620_COT-345]|uniref:rRNA maturation RNase YbeY n=1 Tax=Leptotrichia sp. OH3620_COT-345 TaxID=2491048 RepID=UPI000F655753|nr:rRNA maturation RNase YbeY [Leptotrichia sp. OH3620_COT-345]RRD41044.1 rRNA maturation RNase YbeY [Leptotrichia sp. OH3620_COT-345]
MLECDITYEIKKLEEYLDEEKIEKFAEFVIENEYKEMYIKNNYYLSLLIANNEIIKKINSEYRNKNTETDVISFAYNETENIGGMNVLGDIIISLEKVKDQAKEYGHSEEREFYYVLCHGILHLLGYDHIEEKDKKIMREKEEKILEKFHYIRN